MCLVWGTLSRHSFASNDPPALSAATATFAGAVLIAILVARGERLPDRAHWPGLILLGFLMICLGNGGVIWAEQWVPSGITAVVVASSPFWMSAIEAFSPNGERFTTRVLLGLLIGFAGILPSGPDLSAGGNGAAFAVGLGALQIACIGWPLGHVFKRHALRRTRWRGGAAYAVRRPDEARESRPPRRMAGLSFPRAPGGRIISSLGSLIGSRIVYALKYLPAHGVDVAYVNHVAVCWDRAPR